MTRLLFILLIFLVQDLKSADLRLLEDREKSLTATEAYEAFHKKGAKILPGDRLNAGITESVFWMLVTVRNNSGADHLVIDNPHINRIDFYEVRNSIPEYISTTGDHYPFHQRLFNSQEFVFPLKSDYKTFLLRIDKHDESLTFSAQVLSMDQLYRITSVSNLINGILGGILAIIIIFGLFLFISVKDSLYLFYILYIIMASLWVFTDEGYSFKYLWPDSPYLASRARLIANFLLIISMIRFMQSFLGQDYKSIFYKPLNIIMLLNIGFLCLTTVVPYSFGQSNSVIYIFLIIHLFMDAGTVFLIIFSISEKIRQKNQLAWFYLFSVISLLVFILAEIFVQMGVNNNNLYYFRNFGIQTGIVVEAIILNFGLAHRFNQYKNDKERLLIEKNNKQHELSERIIAAQESERRKIAGQLHDEVGSMLSLVSLQISSVMENTTSSGTGRKLEKAGDVLKSVSSAIRNMSHTLTPIAIEKYGLENAVKDLTNTINLSGKLSAECIVIGFERTLINDTNLMNDLYRIIQELVNNVLKHAEAKHCLIQLIEHPETISLMVEDDGKGMAKIEADKMQGIGLKNIRSKVEYLNGNLEISPKSEGGTLIIIEIPKK